MLWRSAPDWLHSIIARTTYAWTDVPYCADEAGVQAALRYGTSFLHSIPTLYTFGRQLASAFSNWDCPPMFLGKANKTCYYFCLSFLNILTLPQSNPGNTWQNLVQDLFSCLKCTNIKIDYTHRPRKNFGPKREEVTGGVGGRDMQTGLWWGKSWKDTTCTTVSVGIMQWLWEIVSPLKKKSVAVWCKKCNISYKRKMQIGRFSTFNACTEVPFQSLHI